MRSPMYLICEMDDDENVIKVRATAERLGDLPKKVEEVRTALLPVYVTDTVQITIYQRRRRP